MLQGGFAPPALSTLSQPELPSVGRRSLSLSLLFRVVTAFIGGYYRGTGAIPRRSGEGQPCKRVCPVPYQPWRHPAPSKSSSTVRRRMEGRYSGDIDLTLTRRERQEEKKRPQPFSLSPARRGAPAGAFLPACGATPDCGHLLGSQPLSSPHCTVRFILVSKSSPRHSRGGNVLYGADQQAPERRPLART